MCALGLRDLSPLWEMVQEGIDLKTIDWFVVFSFSSVAGGFFFADVGRGTIGLNISGKPDSLYYHIL